MNSIEAAIAQAKSAAGNIGAEANANMGGAVAQYQPQGQALGAPIAKGAPMGFDDLQQGSLNVAGWLKVNKFGMQIGSDATLFDEFIVYIPLNEIAYSKSVRFGNPAQYRKTYDGITDVRGGSWLQTLVEAQKIDQRASEFRSADVPFYPAEAIVNKQGKELIPQGEAMGHSLAVTGWKDFATFIDKARKAGIDIGNDIVKVKLGFQYRKNDKGEWGTLTFSDVEVVSAFPWDLN